MWKILWELVVVAPWDLVILLQWPRCHFYFKFCLNSYHSYMVRYRQLLPIATSSFICKWETGAHPLICNPDLMCYETLEKGFALHGSENFHNLLFLHRKFSILSIHSDPKIHTFPFHPLCLRMDITFWNVLNFYISWCFWFCSLVFVSLLGVKNQNKSPAGEVRQEFWAVPVSVSSQCKNTHGIWKLKYIFHAETET